MTPPGTPRIAVVGHANTGKTSLLQTILRRRDFGLVSPRGGTTRAVEVGSIADDEGEIALVLDTPGLEDSHRLRELVEACREDRHDDPRTLLDRFLSTPAATQGGELDLEAATLRAAMEADVLLYAIDAREAPRPRHLDELTVLAATARPLVPVLNFVARPEADAARWRDACARNGLHATVAFDAVVYDDAGERRLLDAIRALSPDHAGSIDRWITIRSQQREIAIHAALDATADLLVDAAAATVVTARVADANERKIAFDGAVSDLLASTRRRESETRERIASGFGFTGEEAKSATLEIAEALGGVDFASAASLERAGLWAAGGGAGLVAAGAMVDLATGGISLGGFTALGAAGAVLGAAGASGRKILRRLQGREEVRLADPAIQLLAMRSVATVRALLARGHAAIEPTSIEAEVVACLESDDRDRIDQVAATWRMARGRASWSSLSNPAAASVPGASRAECVAAVAAALIPLIEPK